MNEENDEPLSSRWRRRQLVTHCLNSSSERCLSSVLSCHIAPPYSLHRSVSRRPPARRDGGVRRDVTEENGPASNTVPRDGGRPACLVSRRSSPGSFPRLFFTPVHFSSPGGLVPRAGKKGECWTFLDWRLNSENDSPVHGQPSFDSLPPLCGRVLTSLPASVVSL